ncbi:hypothetical protein [Aeoliella mucimassa]|uniref:Carboxypeptidase regulatory-like domain-containing protein n=1 Tax=Aeoliella mucimassa TaxID=2527972 RepID=A0A518APK2_9BACT|nr:hypothetical protein [Aeoliella mucimassa]QDU56655.1 hypothetical protein Pan181_28650 [Aeoliella mucimassa]
MTHPAKNISRYLVAGITTVILATLVGCDSKSYDLVEVSGVVTLDGKPIPGTIVNYQPIASESDSPGPGSVGRCDESGHYTLETIHGESGAVPGSHRIRIYSYSPESPVASDSPVGMQKEQFPERYNYRSELTIDIGPDGTDAADFKLSTDGQ